MERYLGERHPVRLPGRGREPRDGRRCRRSRPGDRPGLRDERPPGVQVQTLPRPEIRHVGLQTSEVSPDYSPLTAVIDVEELRRQKSSDIKNQLGHPRGVGSHWFSMALGTYNESFPLLEANYLYAIPRNSPRLLYFTHLFF